MESLKTLSRHFGDRQCRKHTRTEFIGRDYRCILLLS